MSRKIIYRIAITGDSSTQFFAKELRKKGLEDEIEFIIFEANYDQIEALLLNPNSELFKFIPDYIIIFHSVQKLVQKFYRTSNNDQKTYFKKHISNLKKYLLAVESTNSKIIYFNFPELEDNTYGNYGTKVVNSMKYQLKKINLELMNLASKTEFFYLLDVSALGNYFGLNKIINSVFYINGDITFSPDFNSIIIRSLLKIFKSHKGVFNKCLIIDLDNTMWGGVIGDDGIENIEIGPLGIGKAYTELQLWFKQLKDRGIILCVCSKNTDHIALEPFKNHPEMVLRLDDISVFVANWKNKAENIKYIKSVLNIGFDSMVFIDDNPFERNLVRNFLPQVTVPELPVDPADYLSYLQQLNLFETATLSKEDKSRTRLYKDEAKRVSQKLKYNTEESYLKSLKMKMKVKEFDDFSIPRVTQLIQRSNQFNLRTIRYTQDDIKRITTNKKHLTLSFSLRDNFGDYGLISVVILEKNKSDLFIDSWVMSCRVLKRGVEKFIMNELISIATKNKCNKLIGEYVKTKKNKLVENLYLELGFLLTNSYWELEIKTKPKFNHFIKKIMR